MTPKILQKNGIGYRAMSGYYGMPMGGAVANANDAAAINYLQKQIFDQNPIAQSASFEFSALVSETDSNTANVTVKTTAFGAIPAGVKLHLFITENTITWSNVWPEVVPVGGTTSNGQDIMYDVIWDIIGDTLGNSFPVLASGENHTMTHSFTLYDDMGQNRDSMRVTAVLQVEETKEILAVGRMGGSIFTSDGNPITFKTQSILAKEINLSVNNNTVHFSSPVNDANIRIYNSLGKCIKNKFITNAKNNRVELDLPEARGVYILQLQSEGKVRFSELFTIR